MAKVSEFTKARSAKRQEARELEQAEQNKKAEESAAVEKAASDAIASTSAAKAQNLTAGAQTMKSVPVPQVNAPQSAAISGASTSPLRYAEESEAVKQKMAAEAAAKRTADILEADRKRKAQAEKDRATMEAGAAELAAWSDEDKQNLVRYVADRSNQFANMFGAQQFDNYNTNPLVQKYGIGKVRQMAEIYERQQNEELAKRTEEKAKENVTGGRLNRWGRSAESVGANLIGNITGTVGRAMEMANRTGQFSTLQQYTAGDMPSLYASTVRSEAVADLSGDQYDEQGNQISEGGAVRQVRAYVYQGVMSLADSIARGITLGAGGGAALAASGSFAQSISDASEAGATPAQAVLMGVATAGMEYLTEKIPMEEVFKVAKSGNTNVLMQMFKQAGVEITTEELSLFGTLAAEAAIMQEDSSYNQMIANAMANGMTYEEAKAQANDAIWKQVQETAIVSGIAGAGSGGGSAIVGNVRSRGDQTPTQTEKATEAATAPDTAAQQTEAITTAAEAERAADAPQQTAEQRAAQDVADMLTGKEKTAQPEAAVQVKEHISMEDYANNESPVWKNVAYEDNATKATITQQIHDDMVASGNVVQVQADVADNVDQAFPDLRGMKKAERTPILKQAFSTLKNNLRTFLNGFNGQNFEFEVNGKVLDAKLYNTGIKEVLEKVTKEKAKMLYSTEDIFRNAQYLYSTPDYDGDPNVYRWNYFYTPVKIGDEVVGVRIAVRDVANPQESQIYNWNIKKDAPLGGVGRGKNDRISNDASSDTSTDILQQKNVEVKGTGAAEQNFSGKAQYQDLLYEGNVQPDRDGDVRPMEVPKTDLQGNPVSATAANVYGSQFTTDDLASEEENAIARGDLSYMKIENGKAAERASKNIENAGGWEEAYMQWHDAVREGKTSAEMAARGAMLLNHAAEVYEQTKTTGNDAETKAAKQKWLNILMDVRELGTNTAQGLQAMRMIRELAPPDKLDFAVATVRRMVANMKLQNDVAIDENLLNEYRMAETDEQRAEIMGKIQQNVADQIPSTFLDKWTALRYMNMLGNLKTNVRNVAGNVGSTIAYRVKDQFAATMEDFISAFDKNYQRTKAHAVSRELLNYAKKDFDAVKNAVSGGGKYNERMTADGEFQQGVMDKRTIFKSDNAALNAVMKPLEAYRRGTNWMMNNQYFGDEAFGRAAYARALAGYLKANGIKETDLANVDQSILDKARAYAIREAQEATFKDNTALANIASNVKRATGVVGEGIVPFTKTPANVLVRAEEFSPLGLLNTAYKAAQMAASKTKLTEKNGLAGDFARSGENIGGADIVNSLAKTLTGTALFALGAMLWDNGMLSAGPSDDEEEATLDDLTGKQPYALQFMGEDGEMHSYTMDWLTPIAMPMFMGAEFWKALQEKGEGIQLADLEQLFTSIADPMIQMSMLQGLNDSIDSIKYSENNLGQFFLNAAVSYLTQGLTNTLIGQIERSTEENRMTTYVDENSSIPKWVQQAAGKASQKIPGWDYQQMEYRNKWGDTEKNEGGLLYNLASPGYFSTEQNDAVSKELYRLNETVSEKVAPPDIPKKLSYTDTDGTDHKDYRLTEEQYQKIAEVQGQTAKRILDRMVESKEYKNLTDTQKAYAIDAVYEYAQERGKTAALSRYYSRADEWVRNAKESDLQSFIVQGSKKVLNSAINSTAEALGNNWTVSKAAKDDLEFAWESYSKMGDSTRDAILEAAAGDAAKYLIARGDGVGVNSYLDAVGNVKRLSPENGKKQVSDAQKYEAIANTKSISQDETDALIRAYMPDYDPDNGKTEKTEIRYDYLRQEMKLTPAKTIAAMRIASGDGKKADKFAAWKAMGMSDTQCNTLWNALESTAKSNPVDVVEWSKSKTK